jgi:acetylornithine/N-succinyldiaminopimelate aminotransferase
MTNNPDSKELDRHYFMQAFKRNLKIVKGSGSYVWDDEGKKYLDCVAGIAVCSTGHCHPKVVEAICSQAKELIHVSNLYYVPNQGELAEKLVEISGLKGGRVFMANSGAEANEAALKLARIRTGRDKFISFKDGFHGRTCASLAVTHKPAIREPFGPLQPYCDFVDYGDLEALKELAGRDTAGIFVECIQGEAGVIPAPEGFLKGIREICDDTGALMITDEVQTGMGRTGSWFAYQNAGVNPDIVTIAKGIASGFPMGAIVAREGLSFNPGEHGSTFAGGPVACAAALATIGVIEEVLAEIPEKSERFRNSLSALNPRVEGLMIGISAGEEKCPGVQQRCQERGVLVNCAGHGNLRLVPPLTISDSEIDIAAEAINASFD